MKTTISGRPNVHKIEFPCLMNLKEDKDYVVLVQDMGSGNLFVTCLTGTNLVRVYGEPSFPFDDYEYFVGELTLQND